MMIVLAGIGISGIEDHANDRGSNPLQAADGVAYQLDGCFLSSRH